MFRHSHLLHLITIVHLVRSQSSSISFALRPLSLLSPHRTMFTIATPSRHHSSLYQHLGFSFFFSSLHSLHRHSIGQHSSHSRAQSYQVFAHLEFSEYSVTSFSQYEAGPRKVVRRKTRNAQNSQNFSLFDCILRSTVIHVRNHVEGLRCEAAKYCDVGYTSWMGRRP